MTPRPPAAPNQCYHTGYEDGRNQTLDEVLPLPRDMYGLMMCIQQINTDEFMDYFTIKMEEFKQRYESLRTKEQAP